MIRRVSMVLALALVPALVQAQDTAMTVSAPSAEVHKGPSTVTPVVGHVTRGTVLPISRNLGSWVRVPWPGAPDGVGYVHITMGHVGPAVASTGAIAPRQPAATAAPPASASIPQVRAPIDPRAASRRTNAATPTSHIVGVGGLYGSPDSIGASARAWSSHRVGLQFAFARTAMTSPVAAGSVTALQFEPGAMLGLFDHVSDYVWIRPYVGGTMTIARQTLSGPVTGGLPAASDTSIGFRIFGGGEFTFASVPRFGLSADAGYRRFPTPYAGFDTDRLSIALAGHWYLR